MKRLLPMVILSLVTPTYAVHALGQARQCWLDAMSDAEKRALVEGYAKVSRIEGKARADAWAQQRRGAYIRKFAANGMCPAPRTADAPDPARSSGQRQGQQILDRHGKPCKRLELENQNVPNIGGSMGWALVQVCKD